MIAHRLLPIACAASLAARQPPVREAPEASPAPVAGQPGGLGIDRSGKDTRGDPGDDYFEYVNGNWLETMEIPADKSNNGAFTELFDAAEVDLRAIIDEAAAADSPRGSVMQKVGDMYRSFMNEQRIESLRLQPLAGELRNMDRFYAAFAIEPDDELYLPPAQRVTIW